MTVTIATIITKYNLWKGKVALTATAKATLAGLGHRPLLPAVIDDNADYNSVVTAQATWDTNNAAAVAAYNTAVATQRTFEEDLLLVTPPDTWVKLVSVEEGNAYTVWVGYKDKAGLQYDYIQVSNTEPAVRPE